MTNSDVCKTLKNIRRILFATCVKEGAHRRQPDGFNFNRRHRRHIAIKTFQTPDLSICFAAFTS